MLLGPPAETEKANISFPNENLNSREEHLLHQHGEELCIFQLGFVKFPGLSLKENKSVGGTGSTWERLILHKQNCLPQSFGEHLYITCCPGISGVSDPVTCSF